MIVVISCGYIVFFQAEDGIRDLVRSRGLGDVYKRQVFHKARLFDASGKMDETREWYQKALSLTTNPQLKETIRLRLTFTEVIAKDVQGLVALAKASPRDFRNRAAIALAILDFDKEAADLYQVCLLYTSDAADERSSVDLGGSRIIKKKNIMTISGCLLVIQQSSLA